MELFISRDVEYFDVVKAASLDEAKQIGHEWRQHDQNRKLFLHQRLEESELWDITFTRPPDEFVPFLQAPSRPVVASTSMS